MCWRQTGGAKKTKKRKRAYYGCVITAQPTHLAWIILDLRK